MSDPEEGNRSRAGSLPVSRRQVLSAVTATTVAGAGVRPTIVRGRADDGDGDSDPISHSVFVETGVDSDGDGQSDRVWAHVGRPESTADGEQFPALVFANPYLGVQSHSDATPEMMYDREVALGAGSGATPGTGDRNGDDLADGREARRSSTDEPGTGPGGAAAGPGPGRVADVAVAGRGVETLPFHRVSDGYVVARVASLGTHRSTGCYTAAGPPTLDALASVVDWFNGRATAYDAETGDRVTAGWTTGKTAMSGFSAVGELANGVATTGVDGLEAIVVRGADASHYSLFRANGTPVSVGPNLTDRMRDLGTWIQASNAKREDCNHWTDRVEAGQDRATGDYNDFWHERELLAAAEAVDAAVLIQHGLDDTTVKPNQFADWYETLRAHDVPCRLWLHQGGHTNPGGQEWTDLRDRWLEYWLKGADNGVMDEDPVTVERPGADPDGLERYPSWPVPAAEPVPLRFHPGGRTAGELSVAAPDPATESLIDDATQSLSTLAEAPESVHRLRYLTPPLAESVHVSGRVVPSLSLSFDEPTVVSVALVEYDLGAAVVTRGWADPRNRPAYGEYDTPLAYKESLRESRPLEPGERVRVEFPLQATDHVFEAGNRIGLVVYATDRAFTLHPPGNATVTLSLAESSVDLPVVGGETGLTGAFGEEPSPSPTTTPAPARTPTDAVGTALGDRSSPPDRTDGTTDRTDSATAADGPGFGVGAALAALGGVAHRLRRTDD